MTHEHYEFRYDDYGNIRRVDCAHCTFSVYASTVNPTAHGHRWPRMVHQVKAHIRDAHGINLYQRKPITAAEGEATNG